MMHSTDWESSLLCLPLKCALICNKYTRVGEWLWVRCSAHFAQRSHECGMPSFWWFSSQEKHIFRCADFKFTCSELAFHTFGYSSLAKLKGHINGHLYGKEIIQKIETFHIPLSQTLELEPIATTLFWFPYRKCWFGWLRIELWEQLGSQVRNTHRSVHIYTSHSIFTHKNSDSQLMKFTWIPVHFCGRTNWNKYWN